MFNGKTKITLAEDLTIEAARKKLDEFFEMNYGYSHDHYEISFNPETEESEYGIDERWTDEQDGTASYEFDSRYYEIEEEVLFKVKLTTDDGVSFPEDLQNLTYSKAVNQLNLLAQCDAEEIDRQAEDVLCLTNADGTYELYEIEED